MFVPRSELLFACLNKEGVAAFSRLFNGLSGAVLVCVRAQLLRRLNKHRGIKKRRRLPLSAQEYTAVHDVGEWLVYALGPLLHS